MRRHANAHEKGEVLRIQREFRDEEELISPSIEAIERKLVEGMGEGMSFGSGLWVYVILDLEPPQCKV